MVNVIVKTDPEPAIDYTVNDIVEAKEGEVASSRTIVDEPPVKSTEGNGRLQRTVQTNEGQITVITFEMVLGRKVEAERNTVTFLADSAGYLVNKLELGKEREIACR